MIHKLNKYTNTINGTDCIMHPNLEDCADKINEIIDYVNALTNPTTGSIKKETAKEILEWIEQVCFSKEFEKFRINYGSNGQRDYIISSIAERYGIEK